MVEGLRTPGLRGGTDEGRSTVPRTPSRGRLPGRSFEDVRVLAGTGGCRLQSRPPRLELSPVPVRRRRPDEVARSRGGSGRRGSKDVRPRMDTLPSPVWFPYRVGPPPSETTVGGVPWCCRPISGDTPEDRGWEEVLTGTVPHRVQTWPSRTGCPKSANQGVTRD